MNNLELKNKKLGYDKIKIEFPQVIQITSCCEMDTDEAGFCQGCGEFSTLEEYVK